MVRLAYIDTSTLVAILGSEAAAPEVRTRLGSFDRLISSNLLEAELRAGARLLAHEQGDHDPPDRVESRDHEEDVPRAYEIGERTAQERPDDHAAGDRGL